MFGQFLTAGIAIAGVDVGESYGSPDGRAAFTALYEKLTAEPGLSKKVCLLGRSRGGLMVYNWAAENPDKVACIAGIYPVLDLTTYPGLAKACDAYHLTEAQLRDKLKQHNPVERLAPLAQAKVPIFHIHGDHDTVVPYEENAAEPARRYKRKAATCRCCWQRIKATATGRASSSAKNWSISSSRIRPNGDLWPPTDSGTRFCRDAARAARQSPRATSTGRSRSLRG